MSYALLNRAEGQGQPLDADEAVELAYWLIRTGMVNSAGRYARFAEDVLDDMGRNHWR